MYAYSVYLGQSSWPGHVQRRLRTSLLISAICIVAILSVLRMPLAGQERPFTELIVRILAEEVESVVEPLRVDDQEVLPSEQKPVPLPMRRHDDGASTRSGVSTDWHTHVSEAIAYALDNAEKTYSVNPAFDEKRRQAAVQFAPSKAEIPTPIWENVGNDTLGRLVLWSGDCYRVIDDPNAGSREAFETFGQYIVTCMNWKDPPKELPWVNEIRNRRAGQLRYGLPAVE